MREFQGNETIFFFQYYFSVSKSSADNSALILVNRSGGEGYVDEIT